VKNIDEILKRSLQEYDGDEFQQREAEIENLCKRRGSTKKE
jgi:hypothetical protein